MPFVIKEDKEGEYEIKEVYITQEPEKFKVLTNPIGWKIVKLLMENPSYANKIAKELKINRQNIHYYIKKLEEVKLIKVIEKKEVKGGLAKLYKLNYRAFALELPQKGSLTKNLLPMPKVLENFFHPLISQSKFNGYIVVGSPEPHGPYKASARDGHYSAQLALFLGRYCELMEDFIVKLDVDVKAEKEMNRNMILIGGPGVNLITYSINSHLPIRFNEKNYWLGLVEGDKTYNHASDALIAKIKNPFDDSSFIIILAGFRHIGTKAAIIAITKYWNETLRSYKGEENWAIVVRGFDMNGDGKIDYTEVVSDQNLNKRLGLSLTS